MEDRKGRVLWTASLTNIGTTPGETEFVTPFPTPLKGWVYRLTVTEVTTPSLLSSTVDVAVVDSVTGEIFSEWPSYGLPFDVADVPVSWAVGVAANLKVTLESDDGTNSSDFDLKLVGGAA